jgi:protein arginine kinase
MSAGAGETPKARAAVKKAAAGSGTAGRAAMSRHMPVWLDNRGPDEDVVMSTRIRLARNLAAHKFPGRASTRDKQNIYNEVSIVLGRISKPCGRLEVINFGRLHKLEQHLLVEERMVSLDMLKGEGERGLARDRTKHFSVMINEEDHLRIQAMESGFHTLGLWETTSLLDDHVGRELKYAYNDRLGFLTTCPTNSGTGLRISYLMHLPGLVLTKAIDPVLQGASQMGIATRGFFGENSEVVGNFFQLSNRATMGASETEFIETTSKVITEIVGHERKARERLLKDAKLELCDKVCRAYGILCNARTLSLAELLNLTSALRLGVDCGIYGKQGINDINRMLIIGMPAHLQVYTVGRGEESRELDVARADVARELFGEHLAVKKKLA